MATDNLAQDTEQLVAKLPIIAELEIILGSIADMADHAHKLVSQMGDESEMTLEGALAESRFLLDQLTRAGWLADVGAARIQGGTDDRSHEHWLYPPALQAAMFRKLA